MKRIKQRLLSLAMTGAILLGFTLPEAFASSVKSSNESAASETQETTSKKRSKKQSKNTAAESQSEEKSSKSKSSNKKVSLTLSISKPGGLSASGGVWQVDPNEVSELTLSWKCKGECDSFKISVSGGVYSASTEKKAAKIPISGLPAGKYTATIKAIRDGKTVASDKLSFQIIAPSVDETAEETQEPTQERAYEETFDVMAYAIGEEKNVSETAQSVWEESLDLTEPDIQTPQEEPVEVQAVTKATLPDTTDDLPLDKPDEKPLSEADEPLVLDEPSAKTVLQDSESEFIFSNAGDEKEIRNNTIALFIKGAEGLSVIDGTLHVNTAQARAMTLVWSFGGVCDEYVVSVSGGVYEKTTKKSQLKLPVKNLSSGQYTVKVVARKDGKTLSSARLSFTVDAAGSEGETSRLAITVASPQGLLITEGVYQVDPAQANALTLAWQFSGECDAYDVSVSGDVYSDRTEESTVTVPLSGLAAEKYTVTVVAIRDGEAVAQGQLDFNIPSQDEQSGDDPGKDGRQGGQPQGSRRKISGLGGGASKNGDGQEADQGFRVTPGQALISTHTSGTRDMRLYGAVALTLDTESAMTHLTLGGTALDIRRSDGGMFTASIEADALALVPEGDTQAWLLNGYALKTLARSGVTCLRLTLDDVTVEFPTLPELSGSNYGALCAAGRTSRDYCYVVSSNGCSVTVAGQTFQLTAEGELA